MRLHILGTSTDDKGTQLEILTRDLLESLGYQRLKMNVASDAGEVDVDGEFLIPLPVQPKRTRVIAECKARRDPLTMTDWLKFLGKIFIAEDNNEDVAGCLVALSGVNGNVLGSVESLKRGNVRLVEATTLIEYLSKSHGLAPTASLQQHLSASGRPHLALELAYYERHIYWVVLYDNGQYTLLNANGSYPADATLDKLKPMVLSGLETGTFLDLRTEEAARRSRQFAKKLVIASVMLGNGSTSLQEIIELWERLQLSPEVSLQDVEYEAKESASSEMLMLDTESKRIIFKPEVATDLELRRRMFMAFGREGCLIPPIGCQWWDDHIDEAFARHAFEIQAHLKLDADNQKRALDVMRISPSALMYALEPDPMIVTHHAAESAVPPSDDMLAHDRNHFMRSLYNGLISDFRNRALASYFFTLRRIEALARTTHLMVYERDDSILIDTKVSETTMIGEWHEKDSNGNPVYLHVSALPDFAERRRKAAIVKSQGQERADT